MPFSAEPTDCTEATITIEIPAAIRPYSIAVAPDSFFRNAETFNIWSLHVAGHRSTIDLVPLTNDAQ